MKKNYLLKSLLVSIAFFTLVSNANAVTRTATTTGPWTIDGTWDCNCQPAVTDDIVVADGITLTVDANKTCVSLTLNAPSGGTNTRVDILTSVVLTVNGNVSLTGDGGGGSNTFFFFNGTATANITGDITLNATNGTTAIIQMFNGASTLNLGGSIIQNPAGRLTNTGTESIINYNGTGAQNLNIGALMEYEHITLNNSGSGVTLTNAVTDANVTGNISLQSGTFDNGGFAMTTTDSDSLIIASGTTFSLSGTSEWPTGFDDFVLTGSTVEYTGGTQTIFMPDTGIAKVVPYSNLIVSGGSTKTLGTNLDIDGSLTIVGLTTLDANSANDFSINLAGNWSNSGTFNAQDDTVFFDGTTVVSGSSTTSFNTVSIVNTFSLTGSSGTMNVSEDWINYGFYSDNTGTIDFNGAGTISGSSTNTFNNLTISGALVGPAGGTINMLGNWNNTGTFTHNGGTVDFLGVAAKGITNTTGENYNNMTVTGAGTVTLNDNVIVSGTLTMNSGDIATGTDTLTLGTGLGNEGTLLHAAGTIIGRFQRWINSTLSNFLFPVGTASNLNSATINFSSLGGGTVTAEFTGTDPGNNGLPIEDAALDSVYDAFDDGFWDLAAGNSLAATTYNLDLDGTGFIEHTIHTDSTHLMKRAGGASAWTFDGTHLAAVAPVAKRTVMSGLGQFGLGNVCRTPTTIITGRDSVCTGAQETYTVASPTSTFVWAVTGGTIFNGQGTNTLVVNWNAAPGGLGGPSRNVSVTEKNKCGIFGPLTTLNVDLHTFPLGPIIGDASPFISTTDIYKVLRDTGYQYTFSLTESLGGIVGGCCDSTVTINWLTGAGNDTLVVTVTVGVCATETDSLPIVLNTTYVSANTGFWDVSSTWVGSPPPPTAGDSVAIVVPHVVTVRLTTDSCAAVSLNATGAANARIVVNTVSALSVGGDVTLVGGGTGGFAAITVNGTGTLNIGGDLNFNESVSAGGSSVNVIGAGTVNLGGDLNLNTLGTYTSSSTSTLVMNGTLAQTLNLGSAIVLNHITLANSGPGVTLGGAITDGNVTGNIIVQSGIFDNGGYAMNELSSDNLQVDNGAIFRVNTTTYPAGFTDILGISSTVEYNSNAAQTVDGSMVYGNLDLIASAPSTKTLDADVDIDGNLTIGDNATFDASGTPFNITLAGNWINNGSFTHNNNLVTFDGFTSISGTSPTTFNDVTSSVTLNGPAGNMIVDGAMNISAGTFTGPADTIKVGGDWTNTGTYAPNAGTVNFTGTIQAITGSPTFNAIDIDASSNLTAPSGTMIVAGSWVNDGTFIHNSGSVTFNGSTTISGLSTSTFNNVTSSNILNGPAAGTNMIIAGVLDLTAGTFTGPADTLKIAGNWNNTGTYAHNSGVVNFNISGIQTLSGSPDFSTVAIEPGASVTFPSGNINVAGNWVNDGTFTNSSGTVTFNGTSLISGTSETTFNNVTVSAGNSLTGPATGIDMVAAGNVTIASGATFTGAADKVRVAGNWDNTGLFTHNSGTVNFTGTTQAITAGAPLFNIVEIDASSTLTAPSGMMSVAGNWINNGGFLDNSGTIDFNGTSTISGSATNTFNNLTISGALTGPASGTINVLGNWNNTGTFTHNGGTVDFVGSGAKAITNSGGETFNNLTTTGSGTITLNNSVRVENTLNMILADISTGQDTLLLGTSTPSEGTLIYAAGTVIGRFNRRILVSSTGVDFLFPVGTASNLNAAVVNFSVLTSGGSVTAEFTGSDPGNNGLPIEDAPEDSVYDAFNDGFWDLAAGNGLGTTDYGVGLVGTGFIEYNIHTDSTHVIKRASAVSPWTFDGTHMAADPDTAFRTGLNGLGQFGLGNICDKPTSVIVGPTTVCTGDISGYSVATPTSTYVWIISGGTSDPDPASGQGTSSITVEWNTPGTPNGTVKVVETSQCDAVGDTATTNVVVNAFPTTAITGDANPIISTARTYTVLNNAGYSYTWILDPTPNLGSIIIGACCDTTVSVTWGPTAGLDTIRVIVTSGSCPNDTSTLPIVLGGTFTSSTSGFWDLGTTWVGGSPPGSSDSVIILNSHVVTVRTKTDSCAKISLNTISFTSADIVIITESVLSIGVDVDLNGSGNGFARITVNGTGILNVGGNINMNESSNANGARIVMNDGGASTLNLGGNMVLNTLGTYASGTGNTLNLNGTAAQTLTVGPAFTFNHVTCNNSGSGVTLGAKVTTTGDVTITSGTLNTGGFTLNCGGNFNNSGTFTQGTDTLAMIGSSAQTIGGSGLNTFTNLRINNSSSGVSLTQGIDISSTGTLSLNGGTLSLGGQTLTLLSDASGTARIGEVTGTGDISGNFTIQRYISGADDWRIMGSPVGGPPIPTLEGWNTWIAMSGFPGSNDPVGFPSVYTYDEPTTGEQDFGYLLATDILNPLGTGQGFYLWVGEVPGAGITKTIDLTGTLVKGPQSISVSYTDDLGVPDEDDGWNLIANPFPSDIYWDSVILGADMTPFAYILDPAAKDYITSPIYDNTAAPYETIPSMQGFWVKATTPGSDVSVTILERHKAGDGDNFEKVGNTEPQVELKFTSGTRVEHTYIRFRQIATESYDPMHDAYNLFSTDYLEPNFSSITLDSVKLALNSLPELNQDYAVPLRVEWAYPSSQSGAIVNCTIDATDFSALPMSTCLVLEDIDSAIFTDLRISSYNFDIVNTTTSTRFMLHIGAPLSITGIDVACNGMDDGQAIVTGTGTAPWNYLWLNSNGDTIKNTANISTSDSVSGLAPDTYTIIVTNSGGYCASVMDMVVISEPTVLVSGITQTQDPTCFGDSDGSIDLTVSGGTQPYTFSWSNGESTEDVSNLSAGTYNVNITDGNNCTQTASSSVTDPGQVVAGFTIDMDTTYLSLGGVIQFSNISNNASTYTWDFGDGDSSSALDVSHTYLTVGSYTVVLIALDANGCSSTMSYIINVLDSPDAINEVRPFEELVSIIQSEGNVYIDFTFDEMTPVQISVYNIIGQEVINQNQVKVKKDRVKVNLTNEKMGIYFIKVESKNGSITKKIIY